MSWAAMYTGGNLIKGECEMHTVKVEFTDWRSLVEEVLSVPLDRIEDGAGHGGSDYSRGWINGLANSRLFLNVKGSRIDEMDKYSFIDEAVGELTRRWPTWNLHQVMINRLGPKATLEMHRDGKSANMRYHLPVVTSRHVTWWDEINGEIKMKEQNWIGPVPYAGVLHYMQNDGYSARYHLIVDLEQE